MSNIRSSGYSLSNSDDDESFQMLVGDVERLAIKLAQVSTPSGTTPISSGGTGANNAEQARANLGIPPGLIYGLGINTSQTITTSPVVIALGSLDSYGVSVSASGNFTIQTAGWYQVTGQARCAVGVVSAPIVYLRIYLNGAASVIGIMGSPVLYSNEGYPVLSIPILCNAGDVITFLISRNTGTSTGSISEFRGSIFKLS